MKFSIFKMEQLTALHIGTKNDTYDSSCNLIESDTISAALAAMYAQQGASAQEIETLLNQFSVSAAFPYTSSHHFMPIPLGELKLDLGTESEALHRKALKRVKYAELSIWNRLINGEVLKINKEVAYVGEYVIPISVAKNFKAPFKKQVNQRVNVDRGAMNNETVPFFFEWMYFANNAGLYFIVEAEENIIPKVEELVEQLGHSGIGTDKSVGGGQFVAKKECIELNLPNRADDLMLLSSYIPTEEELKCIDLTDSTYEITKRTGFIAGSSQTVLRHLRRRSIHLFNMGSVLHVTDHCKLVGKVENLRPSWNSEELHPVYRSGRALAIPIKR